MNEFLTTFLDIALSLPTAPFTWLMIPVTLYWIVSLSGIFSLEWLDGADGALDGVADGAAEGLAEGFGEAAGDAVGEGMADALSAADGADAAVHPGGVPHHGPSFHEKAGLGDVPRTFSWSLIVLFGWLISLTGTAFIPGFQELATRGLGIAVLLAGASLALAIGATSLALKPVQRAMIAGMGTRSRELVGQTCTVRTQRVDEHFGQAEVDNGAMVIQVRSMDPGAPFRFGSKAIIYQYDPDRGIYWVTPMDSDPSEL